MTQAARAVHDELRAVTRTILTGEMVEGIFWPFHTGRVVAISMKDENVTLSMDVSRLHPVKLNCTTAGDQPPTCITNSGDFVRTAYDRMGLPTVSCRAKVYKNLQNALNNDDIKFSDCL